MRDSDLMQGLAEVFIQEELGVPSQRKVWQEHLYELDGFRRLFGNTLTNRLKAKESVPKADFPALPPLTLNLKGRSSYDCLAGLSFKVATCKDGVVVVTTDPTAQPMGVALVLDFPSEKLELMLSLFGINEKHKDYTKAMAACWYRFMIDYFCNGYLQVFDAASGERLSYKTAFLPENVDIGATVKAWRKIVEDLEVGGQTTPSSD